MDIPIDIWKKECERRKKDKSNFVGWVVGGNCLTLCKEILRKYRQTNVGSSKYVYQLTIETDEVPRMKQIQLLSMKMQ